MMLAKTFLLALLACSYCAALPTFTTPAPVLSSPYCYRFPIGSNVASPLGVSSVNGYLNITFHYRHRVDSVGRDLYCFSTTKYGDSPVLRLNPGEVLNLALRNELEKPTMPGEKVTFTNANCASQILTSSSINIHFHGLGVPPTCHSDSVVAVLINTGQTYSYHPHVPMDMPPGLYAYHNHVHMFSELALLGGASGVIVVNGIENREPIVAGLPEQIFAIRDNPPDPAYANDTEVPAWDISLNFIPIPYPNYTAPVLAIKPLQKQFWRVVNLCADTLLSIQLFYDNVVQPLQIVALDGVSISSQDNSVGTTKIVTSIRLDTLNRAEFIIVGPGLDVVNATFVTVDVDNGLDGDFDPSRPLLNLIADVNAPDPLYTMPQPAADMSGGQRFAGLMHATVTASRKLYFMEVLQDPTDPAGPTDFFVVVEGQTPQVYRADIPPAIVTTRGSVEDWTIENRAEETHVFHIHQMHFLVIEMNGVPIPEADQTYMDVVNLPAYLGNGTYPSVKIRVDFRGPIVGTFVYHCHILGHEDNGMMGKVQVLPHPAPPTPQP